MLGCIDTRLPFSATGKHPAGVPEGEQGAAYILNVVVQVGGTPRLCTSDASLAQEVEVFMLHKP